MKKIIATKRIVWLVKNCVVCVCLKISFDILINENIHIINTFSHFKCESFGPQ